MAPIDYRIAINEIKPFPYQELFFTTLTYGDLHRMDGCGGTLPLSALTAGHSVLLVTGVYAGILSRKQRKEYERLARTETFHCLRCDSVYTSSESDLTAVCPKCGYKNTKLKF